MFRYAKIWREAMPMLMFVEHAVTLLMKELIRDIVFAAMSAMDDAMPPCLRLA